MRNKSIKNIISLAIVGVIIILMSFNDFFTFDSIAGDKTAVISGDRYVFGEKSKYEVEAFSGQQSPITNENSLGSLSITGDIIAISDVENCKSYEILNGSVCFSYNVDSTKLNVSNDQWHIVPDKTKDFDGYKLDNNIMNGAIIVQASLDGDKWVTEAVSCDICNDTTLTQDYYVTSDIQQVNGCYYRILIAYKEEIETTNSKGKKVKEYAKIVEEYKFYLIDSKANSDNAIKSTDGPKQELGMKIKTKHDKGYSEEEMLGIKDPHYGWDIGQFYVNGFTEKDNDSSTDEYTFYKNVGDTVTLWFNLKEDINCLNGNDKLKINEDVNGYDQFFEIDKTNMKRGTLIIRYTDYQGVVHDPVIYTNYLEASTKTGANTRVELFEEGDYEVALDYEIVDETWVDSYTDYRIYFKFKIRNGNTMVFPYDLSKNKELSDGDFTINGFKLDLAKSRYLNITLTRYAIKVDSSGHISEDARFNGVVKEGEEYTEEGKYVFVVKNPSTGVETEKTIYVGSDKYIRALSKYKSIDEINAKIDEGYSVKDDGTLVAPYVPEPEISENEEVEIADEVTIVDNSVSVSSISENEIVNPGVDEACSRNADDSASEGYANGEVEKEIVSGNNLVKNNGSSIATSLLIVLIIAMIVGGIITIRKRTSVIKDEETITNQTIVEEKVADNDEIIVDTEKSDDNAKG